MQIGVPELFLVLGLLGAWLVGTAFWAWTLLLCAQRDPLTRNARAFWLILIALTYVPGALAYWLLRRRQSHWRAPASS
ncbi:MAG: PLDc N-terminal domain-containing protein [Thermoanaerobaculia bacterium]